jgi:hypothetical protein
MTEPIEHLPPEDEADLAALADGSLYGPRRAALEARLRREPELSAALARQRAVVARLIATAPPAPLSLRLRVEELETQPVLLRRRSWRPAAALALACVMAAFVVLVAAGGPAVEQVLAVAARPATAPAALDRGFEGVKFPRYAKWRATGERRDVIAGREVRTVFYAQGDRVIAYAIARAGRTCVIASAGGDADALARLAVW